MYNLGGQIKIFGEKNETEGGIRISNHIQIHTKEHLMSQTLGILRSIKQL